MKVPASIKEQVERKLYEKAKSVIDEQYKREAAVLLEPLTERKFDKDVGGGVDRDKLKDSDFADPENRAFPIKVPKDVHDAAKALNHDVKGDKAKIKANIIKIAHAKGAPFAARLPKEWQKK